MEEADRLDPITGQVVVVFNEYTICQLFLIRIFTMLLRTFNSTFQFWMTWLKMRTYELLKFGFFFEADMGPRPPLWSSTCRSGNLWAVKSSKVHAVAWPRLKNIKLSYCSPNDFFNFGCLAFYLFCSKMVIFSLLRVLFVTLTQVGVRSQSVWPDFLNF